MRKSGDIIFELLSDRLGKEFVENARSSMELFTSWQAIVSRVWPSGEEEKTDDVPAVAAHSRIRELEHGVLLVEADHPGWIQILQTKQAELLLAVQRRCPDLDIRGIAFILSREPLPLPPKAFSEKQVQHESPKPPDASPQKPAFSAPVNEDFLEALKNLEKSVNERNGF
jgi:hypothetical protein